MFGKKATIKAVSFAMAVILGLGMFTYFPGSAAAAEDEVYSVSIDKTYLKAGDALPVDCSDGLTLEYYVGEEMIDTDSLILTEDYYEKWITVRGYDSEGNVYEDRAYFSKLPVLYINTDDGGGIQSKEYYKSGTMFAQNNAETGKAVYDGAIQIKGRGNTTWRLPKKPYRIKLDKKTDLFGMGANKNWVLIANYIDESLLRNKTAYDLSEQLGLEYMQSTWTDVILNGNYIGNYQLCEQIRIDETRVNIFDWEGEAKDVAKAIAKAEKKKGNILDQDALEEAMKSDLAWITTGYVDFEEARYYTGKTYDDISGGYLFELSHEYDEISKFTTETGLLVMLKSPEYLVTNPEMMEYAQKFWHDFETAYRAEDGYVTMEDGGRVHYTELADIDSMVSYWLVMEIMGNIDSVDKSRYAYLDMDSKLTFGPAWDFDWGSGSITVGYTPEVWKATRRKYDQNFFDHWVDDPYFIAKATEKYWEVRPYLESLFEDGGIIDTQIAYLLESGHADEARWDRSERWPDKARGFEGDAAMFKEFMIRRINWLDAQFATDRFLIGSIYTTASTYPYQPAANRLPITLTPSEEDTYSEHAPATAVVGYGDDIGVNVRVKDTITETLNVYINGLYYDSFEVSGGNVNFVIPSDDFTEELGRKNVISLIGKDADDATTYRNYATVIQRMKPPVPGDVNGDGAVNLNDISLMKRYIASAVTADQIVKINSDINQDGIINSSDLTALKRLITGVQE